jgi:hypothetical protein
METRWCSKYYLIKGSLPPFLWEGTLRLLLLVPAIIIIPCFLLYTGHMMAAAGAEPRAGLGRASKLGFSAKRLGLRLGFPSWVFRAYGWGNPWAIPGLRSRAKLGWTGLGTSAGLGWAEEEEEEEDQRQTTPCCCFFSPPPGYDWEDELV